MSADFHHQHPVNLFMQPVLRELDRSRFERFLYFTGVSYDDQTQLARSRVEHWMEVSTFNDTQLAKRIDADQIDLLPNWDAPELLARPITFGFALDPTPYNGGTTSLQAMWMGVPVLTLHGQHFVSRMGASFMRAARLPDWVVESEDDYVRMARCMAADRRALLQLKRALRGRLRALPGWDVVAHTRAMEAAFEQMVRG